MVCQDNFIKMLNLFSGKWVNTFVGHTNKINNVKLLGSTRIVTCSEDKTIKIWEIATGECLKTIQTDNYPEIDLIEVLSSNKIACLHYINEVHDVTKHITIWDVESGECLKVLVGHSEELNSIKKLSNAHLISGSDDKTIKLWDTNTGECLKTYVGNLEEVDLVENLSTDKILSWSADNTIKVWDVSTGDCLQTLNGHSALCCLEVLSEEKIIICSDDYDDYTIKIWCLKTNSCIMTLHGHSGTVTNIQVISENKIVSSSCDGEIKIWDLVSGDCIKTYNNAYGVVSFVLF